MYLKLVVSLFALLGVAQSNSTRLSEAKKVYGQAVRHFAGIEGRADEDRMPEVSLVSQNGVWYSNFTVGASENLELVISTGHSNLITFPGRYKPTDPSKRTGWGLTDLYGAGSPDGSGNPVAKCNVWTDVVSHRGVISDHRAAILTVGKQAVHVPTRNLNQPAYFRDGLIGYARRWRDIYRESPFFHQLCDGTLWWCRFGLALKTDQTGKLYYGFLREDRFEGLLTTVPITDEWQVRGSVTLNGDVSGVLYKDMALTTDSGLPVILGPLGQVRSLFKMAGMQSVETDTFITGYYNCSAPPEIGFEIGGTIFNVLPAALASSRDGDNCTASIHGSYSPGGWALGQPFFQGKYIDHYVSKRTMGFANLKDAGSE
ncbi:hypothetical protein QQS21_002668 [Conoideocrella luteorostrata]|uniref:Peptidase A1 domain-containing protein n=1 Tax=Conoideocrella luteorostrata TaxID=1105319 RepID=A0AAJ0G2T5_9HYPO|nr:hypothetical protein QQS21_002668 [Conoideocrella luteorostrata]